MWGGPPARARWQKLPQIWFQATVPSGVELESGGAHGDRLDVSVRGLIGVGQEGAEAGLEECEVGYVGGRVGHYSLASMINGRGCHGVASARQVCRVKLFAGTGVRLSMGVCVRKLLLMGFCWGAAGGCFAQDATLRAGEVPGQASKYPLRLHVLAIDNPHRTVRMQPNWCSGSVPDMSGGESSPCSDSGSVGLGGGDDDFAGEGRGDLVTPPKGTIGLNFSYEGCSRIRVAPGFQGLEARWKKMGSRLEVLVPTDAVTDGTVRWERCTLKVVTQEFVYLRMRNGGIVRVSEEAYWKKPALRRFLSGGSETLERRVPVVSVNDLTRRRPEQP